MGTRLWMVWVVGVLAAWAGVVRGGEPGGMEARLAGVVEREHLGQFWGAVGVGVGGGGGGAAEGD